MLLGDNELSKAEKGESKPLGECLSVFFKDLSFFSVYMSFEREKKLSGLPPVSFFALFFGPFKGPTLVNFMRGFGCQVGKQVGGSVQQSMAFFASTWRKGRGHEVWVGSASGVGHVSGSSSCKKGWLCMRREKQVGM